MLHNMGVNISKVVFVVDLIKARQTGSRRNNVAAELGLRLPGFDNGAGPGRALLAFNFGQSIQCFLL